MRGETDAHVSRILNTHAGHIEAMAAAYLKLTDIPPDQAVLCEQVKDGVYRWWFERTTTADPARVTRLESLIERILDLTAESAIDQRQLAYWRANALTELED